MAERQGMRQTIEDCLKKTPAQIIGLAECERRAEALLRAPPYPGDKTAPTNSMAYRDAYQFMTIRGKGKTSVLVGLRAHNGLRMELLYYDKIQHGPYPGKTSGNKRTSCSPIMICQVMLAQEMQFIGTAVAVMVVHLHNHFANGKVGGKRQSWIS